MYGIRRQIPYIQLILFAMTVVTTVVAGALQQGVNLLEDPWGLWRGLPFSLTLLMILGAHEFGHYFFSKRYGVDATLPYFIPAPSFVGTFGAFIKMRSPVMDRSALLDIGAAGPLAGLAVSIPVLYIGLSLSEIVPVTEGENIQLGGSILFNAITWLVHGSLAEGTDILLHPVAFSGWIGLLVTSLNLLPVGQLDGGHVAYAVFGGRQRPLAAAVVVLLVILGIAAWTGWLFWAGILLFMGTGHPPVVYDWIPLNRRRKTIGWFTFLVFAVTFIPKPF